jgi:hypothetical protein
MTLYVFLSLITLAAVFVLRESTFMEAPVRKNNI